MDQNKQSEQSEIKSTGNTIQCSNWFFTLNNYDNDDILKLKQCEQLFKQLTYQPEIGLNGTPHLQGVFKLLKKIRLSGLKKIFGNKYHFEKCRDYNHAIEYCEKSETKAGETYKYGFPIKPRLYAPSGWQLQVTELLKTEANERHIYWFWELNGNVGKSSLCKYLCYNNKNICYLNDGCNKDIIHNCTIHLQKNHCCNIFLIDIPRDINTISYKAIEKIKNGHWTSNKYEGGNVLIDYPHVIVFANFEPDCSKFSKDRWKIIEITEPCFK